MKLRPAAVFAVLAVCLFVGDVDAGWKFWKSSKNEETTTTTTTTAAPIIINANTPKVTSTSVQPTRGTQAVSNSNTNKALAGAADPGLAIGVGSTGTNIRNNARPSRPNPGTEVGLDIPGSRPSYPGTGGNNGQGYRDWAVGLTGAGEGRQPPPRLPNQGPALSGGGQQPAQGTGSKVGTPTGQPQPQGQRPGQTGTGQPVGGQSQTGQQQPGSRPSTPTGQHQPQGQRPGQIGAGQPAGGQSQAGQQQPGNRPSTPTANHPAVPTGQSGHTPSPATSTTRGPQGGASDGRPQVSTLNIGSLNPSRPGSPTSSNGNSPQSRPGSPSGSISPSGGKTWADVAATGTRPQSPTPAPRPGSAQGGQSAYPGQSGQTTPGQTRPSQVPVQPYGQPGHQGAQQPTRPGSATGGAAVAGVAGAAAGTVFSSNPTYSKGNKITDDDLQKLAESLFIKDVNNANRFITLNLQKQTSSSSSADQAPQPLLNVQPEALQIPTIQKVLALYNNYEHDTRTNEYVSPAERAEESLLVDTFLSTNVMSAAMRFLADKGLLTKDYYEYKDTLRRLWFNVYSRGDGKIGSSGFEHVFLSELKLGTEVIGFHNWIYYNAEEVAQRANYLGYIKKLDLGNKATVIKAHIKLNGVEKPVTSMFIGTSPELEMALYTVCFFARPDASCPISLGGTPFNIITHKFRYRGKDLIGSAHPEI